MKRLVVGVALLCQLISAADDDTTSGNYLWDLNIDPLESTNLYGDSSYTDKQSELFSLISEWQSKAGTCDNTYTNVDAEESVYDICGGVCANVTDNFYKLEVDQIYSNPTAPNIVFLLADDWGFNDVGFRSTYMSWTTPTIDAMVDQGITLENYFSHYYCAPSRGALMTGRHATRLGMIDENEGCELPLSEVTMAQEMKSAGYKTYMVGKWHLGSTSYARTPTYRGFDEFYGFYSGYIDYYTKYEENGYLDLHDGIELETNETLLDESMYSVYIFQDKAEEMITEHASKLSDTPMFLYYAIQLVHFPYLVPTTYTARCSSGSMSDAINYCGMNLMLDEIIANISCALSAAGMMDNTVIVLASDNGGNKFISGNNYPYRGHKYDQFRGGLSTNAFIYSPLLDESVRGTKYYGQMHVTDWLPTLMNVATAGQWSGSYIDADIDGVDMWDAILSNSSSPRSEIVHYASSTSSSGSVQKDMVKLDYVQDLPSYYEPSTFFTKDLHSDYSSFQCDTSDVMASAKLPQPRASSYSMWSSSYWTSSSSSNMGSASKTTEIESVYSIKSTGEYLVWLFGVGLLVSLMIFISKYTLKNDKDYLPIEELRQTSSNVPVGLVPSPCPQDGYQKSMI